MTKDMRTASHLTSVGPVILDLYSRKKTQTSSISDIIVSAKRNTTEYCIYNTEKNMV